MVPRGAGGFRERGGLGFPCPSRSPDPQLTVAACFGHSSLVPSPGCTRIFPSRVLREDPWATFPSQYLLALPQSRFLWGQWHCFPAARARDLELSSIPLSFCTP